MHRVALNVTAPRGFGMGARKPAPLPVDACHPAGSPAPAADAAPTHPGRGAAGLQPGAYTVRLTVDGQTLTQPATVKPDPRKLPNGADASPDDGDDE
jgi:hypothetical protein